MTVSLTVELGNQDAVSDQAVLTAVNRCLTVSMPSANSYGVAPVRGIDLRLIRLTIVIFVDLGTQALNSLCQSLARISGVAYVAGENIFFAGPAFGSNTVTSTDDSVKGLQIQMSAVIDQLNVLAQQIQFIGEPFNPPAGALSVSFPVEISDSDGKIVGLYPPTWATVRIAGGTAPDPVLTWNGNQDVAGDLEIQMVNGQAFVTASASADGTIDLEIVDTFGTGLNVSDTATITFIP